MTIDTLFLSGRINKIEEELEITIETYICLFVHSYCDFKISVCFVDTSDFYETSVSLNVVDDLKYQIVEKDQVMKCTLPAIEAENGNMFIAGLCAVLRWAIKLNASSLLYKYSQSLLGFRNGCLVACAESSVWTKFCELQLPNSVRETSRLKCGACSSKIPENLALLEAHLKRPVRTHNILKRKLDIAKKVKQGNSNMMLNSSITDSTETPVMDIKFTIYDSNSSPVKASDLSEKLKNLVITEKSQDFCLDHCYLEGIDLTLADMIVFPSVHYLLDKLPPQAMLLLENVANWYYRMFSNAHVRKAAEKCGFNLKQRDYDGQMSSSIDLIVPKIDQDSLYKRDPSHTKVKCKHRDPSKILFLLHNAAINPEYSIDYCTQLEWNDLPLMLHPANGDLPEKRVDRKCQQIESIVTAVLKVAADGETIVEFCAGGGHVGLLIAYFLPSSKVILIENKESSMIRAKSRAESLGLRNISFYQCNLDYFKGQFDLGVSLHACGVATDLVIQKCIEEQATFVCCPCCYGGVQDTHLLSYPLSKRFHSTGLSNKDYTLLAHFADRTEVNTPTAEQGELCMGLIDTDRAFYAEEHGYKVKLTTLNPPSCSPKHNLLIGISPVSLKYSR